MSFRYFLLLILGISAFVFLAGCVETGRAPVDAIAVWQHQGNTWDVYYSLWDHSAKRWHASTGEAAPISVDEGNDHDPDVSSNDSSAIAVWSKESSSKQIIYFSKWSNYAWTTPASISSSGMDTDPTVAVDYYGNALAVWVKDGKELYYSVFSASTGKWTTPQKINTTGIEKVSLPELTYSEYWDTYFLVFTGEEDGAQYSYEMFYWNGWEGPWWIDYDAVLDNSQPTDERTGISADRNSGFVTYVWPLINGTLESYSYKYDFVTYTFNYYAKGEMPDTAYNSMDIAHGTFTKLNNLYHQPNVNAPSIEKVIHASASPDYRSALTFILDRKVGLTVWWNKGDGLGEIQSAYYENGLWTTKQIVTNTLSGYDRNPAVTPLQEMKLYHEPPPEPYCGDGILHAGEECEVGIPCADPNDLCWLDCKCYDIYYPYCGDGILDPGEECEAGIPCLNPNDFCWIDCKCYRGGRPPPKPPPEQPPPEEPEPPETPPAENETEETISCNSNTAAINSAGSNNFNPSTEVCSDDCAEGYVCDAHSCNCLPATAVITPRCGDGYISTPEVPGGGREECDTGSSSNPKPDTCPYPEVCINCECVGPQDSISCSGNTLSVDKTDLNKYESTMTCTDDCSLMYGEAYECSPSSCTCSLKTPTTCTTDTDCDEGDVCTGGVCTAPEDEPECTGHGDCHSGYGCHGGDCVPAGEIPCDGPSDCEGIECDGHMACSECTAHTTGCCECVHLAGDCDDSTDCAAGEECSRSGHCRLPGEPCTNDDDCAHDDYCSLGGECRVEGSTCTDNMECRPEHVCSDGECVEPSTCGDGVVTGTEECETDEDCGEYVHCADCQCIPYTCDEFGIAITDQYMRPGVIIAIVGQGYESESDCKAAAAVYSDPIECQRQCTRVHYLESDGCCVVQTEWLPCDECTDCPDCPPEYSE